MLLTKLINDNVEKIHTTYTRRIKSHNIKEILEINLKEKVTPLLKQ